MNLKTEELILIDARSWRGMLLIAFVIVAALAFGWAAVRWQIGNMLAELTSPNEPNALQVANAARSLSPSDPVASWLSAVSTGDEFSEEKLAAAAEAHRETVRLSPNHYPWWLELGRALEQANRPEEAEKAFLRAVELAPSYTLPRWQLGNFLLRAGRDDAAFAQLKEAAENDPVYREQVFSIMWDFFEQDPEPLDSLAGDSPGMRVGLAKFYAAREQPSKSVEIWNTLTEKQQKENREVGALIARAMFDKRFLRASVEFTRSLGLEQDVKIGSVQNAGFEREIVRSDSAFFDWKIDPAENVRIQLSRGKKRSGERSLQLSFSGYSKSEFNNVYKTVALEPGESYKLSFWVRTEELRSAGAPKIEVLNAKDGKIIAATDPFPNGSTDWKQLSVTFTVPEDAEGVMIRTARAFCGDNCPIFGTVWYDDFELRPSAPPAETEGGGQSGS